MFKKKKKKNVIQRKKIDMQKIKLNIKNILTNRLVIVGMLFCCLFSILIHRLFVLQIVEGQAHLDNFNYKVEKTVELEGSRGNIYDCKGNLLAYNELAYSIKLGTSDKTAEIARATGRKESTVRNEIIYNLIQILEKNGDHVEYDLPLRVNSKGKLKFTESGYALTRFKKDIYGIVNINKLEGEEKEKAERWMNTSPEEVYEYLRTGKDGPSGCANMFNIDDSYSVEDTLKIMSIRYDLYMNRYSQTSPIVVAKEISEESIAEISESESEFPGISIEANSLRKYNDPQYFSAILGYTGVVSESELADLNKEEELYQANDIVGKTGIEKTMESILQGKKGEQKVLVDNLGKIIKVVETTDASAGNDVYLTIDADLQKYAYNILERRLAGILLAHFTKNSQSGSDKMIPIKNVYYALFDNNVINMDHLSAKSAKTNEKVVYQRFQTKQESVLKFLKSEMKSGSTMVKNYSDANEEYVTYIIDLLKEKEVLDTTVIDEEDSTFLAWKSGKITLRKYLKYAINQEWINISSFEIDSDYYNSDEIFDELINYVIDALKIDENFDKIIYKYMIKSDEIEEKQICMILYEQGVLDKKKDSDYDKMASGSMNTYTFMYEKVRKLEITPAQLALDPYSGSIIITDPETGDVKAMVSYPSYDNNLLANGIDSEYYAKLIADKSSPMLNRCTQTRTAPGSTFKPITATAILEEKVADGNSYVKCTGIFDKISPPAKCWIYPSAHGTINISDAIGVSCNNFFFQMGYNLGTVNKSYDSEVGLKKIAKYAAKYGLDSKSGVEIMESEPLISDEDAVRSAIGQGTHDYTPSQISRYVTSLVNEKSLVNLSLLDRTADHEGKESQISKNDNKVKNLDVSKTTFRLIKQGMKDVVYGKDSSISGIYKDLKVKVAGKTGTAQENKKRANHALFISYAPYNDPKITMTVVIPNGYTSHNAAEIAKDVYKYYFKETSQEEESQTTALLPSGSDSSND